MASVQQTEVRIGDIDISKFNTRKNLEAGTEDADLDALARNIEKQGLIQPVIVRESVSGKYELIAGQRRLFACQKLGMETIRAEVRSLTDSEALALSLTENVQRADMHPLDKARAFSDLEGMHGSISAVSRETGVSERTVRRYLTLLRLPSQLQQQLGTGKGPAGVGALSQLAQSFVDPEEMQQVYAKLKGFTGELAEQIIKRSRGDADLVDVLVDRAIEGEFDRTKCGSSLDTCPYLPEHLRPVVLGLLSEN